MILYCFNGAHGKFKDCDNCECAPECRYLHKELENEINVLKQKIRKGD